MELTLAQLEALADKGIEVNFDGLGFDYNNQAWIKDGRYIRCGHPESMNCECYGRKHEGELIQSV